ncbi:hypothetical protein N7532_003374 [Penicillium argentinense]|uniref:Uncharacterized protein n=1 Tax=Penicillium argentinense TaxID=1131581 RepID=A0A9W9FMX4_9EURO|nr:uncharacterized protein N7532_003374 [Penicillium argentinense]KAJ5102845.1 hypothetical protein N7532_003374 [Penicillium argentinense]
MAEPEDLEEDLFADLYDADESTNRTTSAVEAPKPAEPAATATPALPTEEPAAQNYEPQATESHPTYSAPQHNNNSGYQNGSEATPAAPAAAPPVDQELQGSGSGTGIKEDG